VTRVFTRRETTEYAWYISLVAALGVAYLGVSFVLPALGAPEWVLQDQWFGFSQLRWAGAALTLALLALVLLRARRAPAPLAHTSWMSAEWAAIAIAVAAATIFFLLRDEVLNSDAQLMLATFRHAARTGGVVITHDEMLEYYVHYRLYLAAHEWWGWGVRLTYQALSSAAGGLFVLLLIGYCRIVEPSRSWALAGLCLSGGYVQLFFGEVENYTLTATLIMAYLLASAMFHRGRVPVWQPSVMLALAMAFHLLAGFLTPSLAYLWWLAWRRGEWRSVLVAAASFVTVLVATVAYFHWNGLPIANLYSHSHACGQGGHFGRNLARPSLPYYRDLLNMVMLLAPVIVLAIPLLVFGRIPRDPEHVQLLIASGVMLGFVFTWRAQLGVYQDWNLFAAAALPVSLLLWRNVVALDFRRVAVQPVPVLAGLASMHSLAWIVANHFCK